MSGAGSLSRRDLLCAFLGAPLAMAACRRGSPAPLPAGEIVFPSQIAGHRLRDGASVTVAEHEWQRAKVVIVGGGVAGLSAAWRMRRAGFDDFTLLELDPVVGGTAKSGDARGLSFPWGAHYVTAPMAENRLMTRVLDEVGVLDGVDDDGEPRVAEQRLCRDPEERIFYRGSWYEGLYLRAGATDDDRAQWKAFRDEIDRLAALRDGKGRRAFALPVARSSDDAEITALDKLTMAEWAASRGFTSKRLLWMIDYACRDDYGATPDQVSAWAGLFYFASRVAKPGRAPQPVITWPNGNGHLVEHLAAASRDRTRTSHAVIDIASIERDAGDGGIAIKGLAGDRPFGIHAERVIFAAPQFLTRYVIDAYRKAPPPHLDSFRYGAWMVANLALRERPPSFNPARGFPLAWDNVIYESPSLGYVVSTHQADRDRGPTVITYYYPLCDADPGTARRRLLSNGHAEWSAIAMADLSIPHPDLAARVERLDVMRWGHAMIRPSPGFLWSEARRAAARPFGRVHFAHSDLSGVALFEEALYQGVRAAEEVLDALGVAHAAWA